MELSSDEQLALGGILRFALRFDGLSAEERAAILVRAGDALGLRVEEVRRSAAANAGYRDAAIVMRSVTNQLDAYLARAEEELTGDAALRAAIDRVGAENVRLACVLVVDMIAREADIAHERTSASRPSPSTLFSDWLREHWRMPASTV